MYKKYIDPSDYAKEKAHQKEMSKLFPGMEMGCELAPVDMNYGAVEMEVTQKSKSSDEAVKRASEANANRFGYSSE